MVPKASCVITLQHKPDYCSLVVQKAQRVAAFGIWLRHSGHFLSVGSSADLLRLDSMTSLFKGCTTKKNITLAISRNEIMAFRKSPYINRLWLMVKYRFEKSGLPPMAAINGVTKSLTSEFTMPLKAAPMTTATARSTALPRRINFLKSFNIICSSLLSVNHIVGVYSGKSNLAAEGESIKGNTFW